MEAGFAARHDGLGPGVGGLVRSGVAARGNRRWAWRHYDAFGLRSAREPVGRIGVRVGSGRRTFCRDDQAENVFDDPFNASGNTTFDAGRSAVVNNVDNHNDDDRSPGAGCAGGSPAASARGHHHLCGCARLFGRASSTGLCGLLRRRVLARSLRLHLHERGRHVPQRRQDHPHRVSRAVRVHERSPQQLDADRPRFRYRYLRSGHRRGKGVLRPPPLAGLTLRRPRFDVRCPPGYLLGGYEDIEHGSEDICRAVRIGGWLEVEHRSARCRRPQSEPTVVARDRVELEQTTPEAGGSAGIAGVECRVCPRDRWFTHERKFRARPNHATIRDGTRRSGDRD